MNSFALLIEQGDQSAEASKALSEMMRDRLKGMLYLWDELNISISLTVTIPGRFELWSIQICCSSNNWRTQRSGREVMICLI